MNPPIIYYATQYSQEKCDLEFTEETKGDYLDFFWRQLALHPKYLKSKRKTKDHCEITHVAYGGLLANKLLLFLYLNGRIPITAGYGELTEEKRILTTDDLYLLRLSEIGHASTADPSGFGVCPGAAERAQQKQTDRRLFLLVSGMKNDQHNFRFPSYGKVIDELGSLEKTIEHFKGVRVTYRMVKKCHSPNPLTWDHGGFNGRRSHD